MTQTIVVGRYGILVDDDVYSWAKNLRIYVPQVVGRVHYFRVMIGRQHLARAIFGDVPASMVVDHMNRDRLDCRRENLRICTQSQNMQNTSKQQRKLNGHCSSKFRGVCRRSDGKWIAQIVIDGIYKWLGSYTFETEAAEVYDAAAKELFGEFCGALNFPSIDLSFQVSCQPSGFYLYAPSGEKILVDSDVYDWARYCKPVVFPSQVNIGGPVIARVIMGVDDGSIHVDHIDGDGLNNCRSNLRLCSREENSRNRSKWTARTSKYKGVSWKVQKKKWGACIYPGGKTKYIDFFDNEKEAARAYDNVARRLYGEFAKLNFPDEVGVFVKKSIRQANRLGNWSSRFRGVSLRKRNRRWESSIRVDNRTKYLGSYIYESDAAIVYNHAAISLLGAKAKLNEVPGEC